MKKLSLKTLYPVIALAQIVVAGNALAGERYEETRYNSDYLSCAQVADNVYSAWADSRRFLGNENGWSGVKGSDKEWLDVFKGCMLAKGHEESTS